jgi:hypothetical protein
LRHGSGPVGRPQLAPSLIKDPCRRPHRAGIQTAIPTDRGSEADEYQVNGKANDLEVVRIEDGGAFCIGPLTYTGDSANAQGKWYYFLRTIPTPPTVGSIKAILSYAMNIHTVARVVFDAQQGQDPNADHYIYVPAGASVNSNPVMAADIARLRIAEPCRSH